MGRDPNAPLFGCAVATSGTWMAVGAYSPGAVYLYEYVGEQWQYRQRLTIGEPGACFGQMGALSSDTLVVGAPHHDFNNSPGQVFVYKREGAGWSSTASPPRARHASSWQGASCETPGQRSHAA